MDYYKNFEGFKKIENSKGLKPEEVLALFDEYKDNFMRIELNGNVILLDLIGKYDVLITVFDDSIKIERDIDENMKVESNALLAEGKSLIMADCDRLIDQVYDMLVDYMKNGKVTEKITFTKRIYYVEESKDRAFLNTVPVINFKVYDETRKELYLIKNNIINKSYSVQDPNTKQVFITIHYSEINNNTFVINTSHFDMVRMHLDEESQDKTIFKGQLATKELKLTADYSDNHYMVELGEIVIGAFDCTDPLIKSEYKIQINNLEKFDLVLAMVVLSDLYNSKEGKGIKN